MLLQPGLCCLLPGPKNQPAGADPETQKTYRSDAFWISPQKRIPPGNRFNLCYQEVSNLTECQAPLSFTAIILVKNHGMLQFTKEVMRMKVLNYRVLLRKEPEGGFTVVVPSLPGCITYGETIEEAIAMSREAIELYLDSLIAEGEEILSDEETMEYTLNLQRDDL